MKQKEKKNKLSVVIFDEEYVIKGEAEQEYIEKVASFVDKKMEQISHANSLLSPKQIAVLVSLNVTDELLRLRKDYDELIKVLNGLPKVKN
jgi:cell division protein ZapA